MKKILIALIVSISIIGCSQEKENPIVGNWELKKSTDIIERVNIIEDTKDHYIVVVIRTDAKGKTKTRKTTAKLENDKIVFPNGRFVTVIGDDKIDVNGNTYVRSK